MFSSFLFSCFSFSSCYCPSCSFFLVHLVYLLFLYFFFSLVLVVFPCPSYFCRTCTSRFGSLFPSCSCPSCSLSDVFLGDWVLHFAIRNIFQTARCKQIYPTYLYCKILRDKLRKRQFKETDTRIQSYHADFMYCHLIFALFFPSPHTKSPASSQSYSYPYDAIVHKSWQINSPMSFNISMDIDPFNCHPLMRLLGVGSGYNFPENRPGNLPLFPGFGWTGNEKVSIDSGRLRG